MASTDEAEVAKVLDPEYFGGDCVKAERRGVNALVLRKLDSPRRRADGKNGTYQLEYRWFKSESTNVSEPFGNDFSLWLKKEIDFDKGLFEQFRLFA
jgi:hypothetical protein